MERKESLWTTAVLANDQESSAASGERILLIAGSKSVGKSGMIQKFLEQNENIKETLAMEYSYGRKSGRSLKKNICHVWELGGGTLFANLLPVHIGKRIKDTTLILVLNLSSPETLWHMAETILGQVYEHLKKVLESEGSTLKDSSISKRIKEDHEDFKFVSEFPLPLVVVGGKYDLFENFDPEKKKIICRTLRQISHSLGASLVFYSAKDPTLVKRLKDVFNYYGFGGSLWKGLSTDFNKPISIHCGSDSFQQIGIDPTSLGQHRAGLVLDRFKHTYTTYFPQELEGDENFNIPEDPARDQNFKEPIIDALRAEKDEELERYQMEIDSKKKSST